HGFRSQGLDVRATFNPAPASSLRYSDAPGLGSRDAYLEGTASMRSVHRTTRRPSLRESSIHKKDGAFPRRLGEPMSRVCLNRTTAAIDREAEDTDTGKGGVGGGLGDGGHTHVAGGLGE